MTPLRAIRLRTLKKRLFSIHLLFTVLLLAGSAIAQEILTYGNFSNITYSGPTWWPVVAPAQYNQFSSGYTAGYDSPLIHLNEQGTIAVGTNPASYSGSFVSIGDHTTGSGSMLMVNGRLGSSALNDIIWSTSVSGLETNTTYDFEAWAVTLNATQSWYGYETWKNSNAILGFQAYDESLSQWTSLGVLDLTSAAIDSTVWTAFNGTWNSGSNTATTLRIINLQNGSFPDNTGNDFALDDISFSVADGGTGGVSGGIVVPEPGSGLLIMTAGLLLIFRKRRNQAAL